MITGWLAGSCLDRFLIQHSPGPLVQEMILTVGWTLLRKTVPHRLLIKTVTQLRLFFQVLLGCVKLIVNAN